MIKKLLVVMILALALLFITACGVPTESGEEPGEVTLPDELPAEVQAWIDSRIEQFGAQTFRHEGILYLLVTYGEKPTGGFEVEITDISEEEDKLVVTANFVEPGEEDVVIQALTYPYDLAMLEDPGLPVEFIATGAESEVPVID
ncbi:MAG: protease complex subunit PrcB family protein [Bacillota bacterium]|nr:protease complex subunit PrcB family protein [Bacillota bacterium]